MIVRVILKNIFSFKEQTEFNLLPDKTKRFPHHKIKKNGIDILRLGALYGANGSGKSNLIKAIFLLDNLVSKGELPKNNFQNIKFLLDVQCSEFPSTIAIEFVHKGKMFFYSLTFEKDLILDESLSLSDKDKDTILFQRTVQGEKQKIQIGEIDSSDARNQLFLEILETKLLSKNDLLFTFIHNKYSSEYETIDCAYLWFKEVLLIIETDAKLGGKAHILDENSQLRSFANQFISTMGIGISNLEVVCEKINEFALGLESEELSTMIARIKDNPDTISLVNNSTTGEEYTLVNVNKEIIVKKIVTSHLNNLGTEVKFNLGMESDGTNRIIDYIPAFNGIINGEKVVIIDEIERSIHPIVIKEVLRKISGDTAINGQLIFTTHESQLLDQSILRPDEIWFAQKDIDGSSKLYTLSDFNVHHTANIENGYLNGRYGGIPLLSNLNDLNWHQDELHNEE
jgi:hypothetical protein